MNSAYSLCLSVASSIVLHGLESIFHRFLQEYLIEPYSSMSERSDMEGYFCCWPFALIKNLYAH